jgi:hypothetical protein
MKKLLGVLAIVALSANVASAQDKGADFKFGGELRTRYSLTDNATFMKNGAHNESHFLQRNQFHVNAVSSNKLQAYFNFLHAALWGQGVPAGGQLGTSPFGTPGATLGTSNAGSGGQAQNALQVHEAWLWWKINDMASLKAGRMTMTFGDGIVVSKNDWLAVPYNWDGIMTRWSWDFLDLDVGGAKILDGGLTAPNTPASPNAAAGGGGTDSEIVAWGAQASIKNLPDVLKVADLFVMQLNGDAGTVSPANTAATFFVPGLNATALGAGAGGAWGLTTYGLHLKGDVAIVDYRLDAVMQSGKQKGTTDLTIGGTMYEAEVGAKFPEFMKARVYASYHMDSGDDNTTADKNEGYNPLFYDTHKGDALDFFKFGNLTAIKVGLNLQPADDTWAGVEYAMFTRSTDKAAASTLNSNSNATHLTPTHTATANTEKGLGNESMFGLSITMLTVSASLDNLVT